ncbi:collagen alpha-1(III) chain-like [Emydura macquarii macquarii]|uniref:collagen alpha-1(III) chain-like n=1 Tax=Emydura macquarii macquarii TaxID=1129001 RepID=UPI00352B2482
MGGGAPPGLGVWPAASLCPAGTAVSSCASAPRPRPASKGGPSHPPHPQPSPRGEPRQSPAGESGAARSPRGQGSARLGAGAPLCSARPQRPAIVGAGDRRGGRGLEKEPRSPGSRAQTLPGPGGSSSARGGGAESGKAGARPVPLQPPGARPRSRLHGAAPQLAAALIPGGEPSPGPQWDRSCPSWAPVPLSTCSLKGPPASLNKAAAPGLAAERDRAPCPSVQRPAQGARLSTRRGRGAVCPGVCAAPSLCPTKIRPPLCQALHRHGRWSLPHTARSPPTPSWRDAAQREAGPGPGPWAQLGIEPRNPVPAPVPGPSPWHRCDRPASQPCCRAEPSRAVPCRARGKTSTSFQARAPSTDHPAQGPTPVCSSLAKMAHRCMSLSRSETQQKQLIQILGAQQQPLIRELGSQQQEQQHPTPIGPSEEEARDYKAVFLDTQDIRPDTFRCRFQQKTFPRAPGPAP